MFVNDTKVSVRCPYTGGLWHRAQADVADVRTTGDLGGLDEKGVIGGLWDIVDHHEQKEVVGVMMAQEGSHSPAEVHGATPDLNDWVRHLDLTVLGNVDLIVRTLRPLVVEVLKEKWAEV